jgi:hypothetical protein
MPMIAATDVLGASLSTLGVVLAAIALSYAIRINRRQHQLAEGLANLEIYEKLGPLAARAATLHSWLARPESQQDATAINEDCIYFISDLRSLLAAYRFADHNARQSINDLIRRHWQDFSRPRTRFRDPLTHQEDTLAAFVADLLRATSARLGDRVLDLTSEEWQFLGRRTWDPLLEQPNAFHD